MTSLTTKTVSIDGPGRETCKHLAMTKGRRIGLGILIIIAGAIGVGVLLNREPLLEGKPLSVWLWKMSDNDSQVRRRAEKILTAAGSETIPYLVRALNRKNSALSRAYISLRSHLPIFVRDRMPYPTDQSIYRYNATTVLGEFGAAAKCAVPDLTRLLKDDDDMVRYGAAAALGSIGPDAREAIPDLRTFLKVSGPCSQVFAAWALWSIDPTGQTAIATQVLTAAVADSFNTGWKAIRSLDQMDQVHLAVPPLVEALKAPDQFKRSQPQTSLRKSAQTPSRLWERSRSLCRTPKRKCVATPHALWEILVLKLAPRYRCFTTRSSERKVLLTTFTPKRSERLPRTRRRNSHPLLDSGHLWACTAQPRRDL